MRLIIHPGWSKTGTTAVQNHFARHSAFYRARGVVYPAAGRQFDSAHHGLALALRPLPGLTADRTAAEIVAAIGNEARGMHTLILSSELSPIYFDHPAMRPLLDMARQIQVVFTVRRQSELLVSLFKQIKCDVSIVTHDPIETFFAHHLKWMDFASRIAAWQKARPSGVMTTFHVLPFAPHGMVKRFVEFLGLDQPGDDDRADRVSRSDFHVAVLCALDRLWAALPMPERVHLLQVLDESITGAPDGFSLLSCRERCFVDICYAASNAAVAAEFLGKADLFAPLPVASGAGEAPHPAVAQRAQMVEAIFRGTCDV